MLTPNDYTDSFNRCLYKEPPFCTAACPFHIDILSFIDKIEKRMFSSAYSTYRNAVAFPEIVSKICHQPCNNVCPRAKIDTPINLLALEKSVLALVENTKPNDYNIPKRNKRIAIIGAGISGLGLALRLASKKYHVEIFEASDHIGGKQRDIVGAEIFDREIENQFKFEDYTLHLNKSIESRDEINSLGFAAVFVATGKGGIDFNLLSSSSDSGDKFCLLDSIDCNSYDISNINNNVLSMRAGLATDEHDNKVAWFAGGSLIGNEGVYSLADGLLMGTVIETYLKTGLLARPLNDFSTSISMHDLRLSPDFINDSDVIKTNELSIEDNYTNEQNANEEAMIKEAERCLKCRCDACKTFCDLTDFTGKWPQRIKDEVIATTLPGSAEVKATPAKRLIFTCNQCGVCKDECPENIDIGGLILSGRRSMHKQEKAPWAFHDYWLRDMDFANGDLAKLVKTKSTFSSDFAFFPGCQLGASDPNLVSKTYEALTKINDSISIMIRCCGTPAEWSGDVEKHLQSISSFRHDWESLGKPTLLAACPTCISKINEYIPEIPIISVYEYLADNVDLLNIVEYYKASSWSVFDPCSAGKQQKESKKMRDAVRTLSKKSGLEVIPLPIQDKVARCCGYGGHPDIANPNYYDYVVEKRSTESDLPYITYCVNCRDSFLQKGKHSKHILDIIFPDDSQALEEDPQLPTVTERNENRIILKTTLLKKYWDEKMDYVQKDYDFKLIIEPELKKKIDDLKIIEDEIYEVIEFLLSTKRIVRDEKTNILSGYKKIGNMTYWVSFSRCENDSCFKLENVWCHRMSINIEPVWNGKVMEERTK